MIDPEERKLREQRREMLRLENMKSLSEDCHNWAVKDNARMEQIRQLEKALSDRNLELLRVRDQRDRYKNALMLILDNMNSEPYAGEFARDVLRGMTADEYARQIRLDHAEVSRKLYEGEG